MTGTGHDAVLLDLDGVVYAGPRAVDGAPAALARLRDEGTAVRFVTNNASRTPQQVADTLAAVGVQAGADEVLTSPQAAVALLTGPLGLAPGARVAVTGGRGLMEAVAGAGLRAEAVTEVAERPDALVQGFGPDLGWAHLAATTRWVREGVTWVATNLDRTIPTEWGVAPGNGLLVGTVADTVGRRPDAVAGKPEPHLFTTAARSCGARTPLVVGDRLDTDIAGGRAAGQRTALVLTGVHDVGDALRAEPDHRPDELLTSLADLWDGEGRERAAALTAALHEAWSELDAVPASDHAGRQDVIDRRLATLSPVAG